MAAGNPGALRHLFDVNVASVISIDEANRFFHVMEAGVAAFSSGSEAVHQRSKKLQQTAFHSRFRGR